MNANSERIIALFSQAMAKESAEERAAFLAAACQGEPELREQVESLLQAEPAARDFLKASQSAPTLVLPTEKPGDRIGRYKLLQQIGEGGCGVVYMAEQEEPVRRRVALKVIKLGMDTKQLIARFEAERQALALMDHPNIAKVLDAGATETGRPYFVMELVRGVRITDYCDQNNLSTRARLKLFGEVCCAIQHAHQKGIGFVHWHQGRHAEAEAIFREAIALRRKLFGSEHPDVAMSVHNLGGILRQQGKLAEAAPLCHEALAVRKKLLGAAHPDVADTLEALATILCASASLPEAENAAREALTLRTGISSNESPWLAASLDILVRVYQHQGDLQQAESLARESLAIWKTQQPGVWQRFNCESVLGEILMRGKKYSEAEPLLLEGHRGMKELKQAFTATDKPRLKGSVARLVQLYEVTNRPDQAAEWKRKLAELDSSASATPAAPTHK